jgi:hypothetical protein
MCEGVDSLHASFDNFYFFIGCLIYPKTMTSYYEGVAVKEGSEEKVKSVF